MCWQEDYGDTNEEGGAPTRGEAFQSEWKELLSMRGCEGGLSAVDIDYEAEQARMERESGALPQLDQGDIEKGKRDMFMMKRHWGRQA